MSPDHSFSVPAQAIWPALSCSDPDPAVTVARDQAKMPEARRLPLDQTTRHRLDPGCAPALSALDQPVYPKCPARVR
jgi:hypothetical protein